MVGSGAYLSADDDSLGDVDAVLLTGWSRARVHVHARGVASGSHSSEVALPKLLDGLKRSGRSGWSRSHPPTRVRGPAGHHHVVHPGCGLPVEVHGRPRGLAGPPLAAWWTTHTHTGGPPGGCHMSGCQDPQSHPGSAVRFVPVTEAVTCLSADPVRSRVRDSILLASLVVRELEGPRPSSAFVRDNVTRDGCLSVRSHPLPAPRSACDSGPSRDTCTGPGTAFRVAARGWSCSTCTVVGTTGSCWITTTTVRPRTCCGTSC